MKPTLHHLGQNTRRDSRVTGHQGFTSLKTDYCFQPRVRDFSGGGSRGRSARPSFRGISAHYFSSEVRSHFAIEASVFGIIVITAAVPVIGALGTFWKSFV